MWVGVSPTHASTRIDPTECNVDDRVYSSKMHFEAQMPQILDHLSLCCLLLTHHAIYFCIVR